MSLHTGSSLLLLTLAGVLPPAAAAQCPSGAAVAGPDGTRRLALVVGVGQYRVASQGDKQGVDNLAGPPNDARRVFELLTGSSGYGFPTQNVCLLIDADATVAGFARSFDEALVKRVQRPTDVAVLYFAGHGSRQRDENGDEPDEWDETLLLHDSRTGGVGDLVDDEFNAMIVRLWEKTKNVVVMLDSCHSGTATRGPGGALVSRLAPPATAPPAPRARAASGDGAQLWSPTEMPGLVVLAAASEATSAFEVNGAGIFTDSLVRVLSEVGSRPLLYAQASRQIPPLVAARSYQIPYFHGELDRPVFGNTTRTRPAGWELVELTPSIRLTGPPLPGLGKNAELRVYAGNAAPGETQDPTRAKATIVIERVAGVSAWAHLLTRPQNASALEIGDLAVLARVADDYLRLRVRLRPADEPGGLPPAQADAIRKAIRDDPEAAPLVEATTDSGDFELALSGATLVLRSREGRVRNTYAAGFDPGRPAEDLWRHARQRALLELRGETGSDFQDNQTLQVQLKPAAAPGPCMRGEWRQAGPNQEQVIPLCGRWNIEVTLAPEAKVPLLVGGLVLSTDGQVYAFPRDGRVERLEPGRTVTLSTGFIAVPPLDVQDRVLVFGTQEKNPVPWHLLAETAATRSAAAAGPTGPLFRTLDRYLRPGSRGVALSETVDPASWTMSTVPVRVEANVRFLQPADASQAPKPREYTIPSFDIRPYLPDLPDTALYKVLRTADGLARRPVGQPDGVPYKQHAWDRATDEENLGIGIDCSRAVWYAFTRSGLPYNRSDAYLATAQMTAAERMQDQFDSCTADADLRLGDVLVYRDESAGVGHVVMVIDPEKRIAWGSHGWDGNVREGMTADTGVEYQLIKYKKDWQRWDRPGMEREACWRYRRFIEEARSPGGQPGSRALAGACDAKVQCGEATP
jgi:hypothetical protein